MNKLILILLFIPINLYANQECNVVEEVAMNVMREHQRNVPKQYFEKYIAEEIKSNPISSLYQMIVEDAYAEPVKMTDLGKEQAVQSFGEKYKNICESSKTEDK